MEVLDLFAGSGVAAKMVAKEVPGASVLAVDLMIRGSEIDIEDVPQVTWLRTDARVAVGDRGAVDRRFDLVGLDPPHGDLIGLVFGKEEGQQALVDNVSNVADWALMYVGHATQAGRVDLINVLLAGRFKRTAWLQLGQEILVLMGPKKYLGVRFETFVSELLSTGGARDSAERLAGWPRIEL